MFSKAAGKPITQGGAGVNPGAMEMVKAMAERVSVYVPLLETKRFKNMGIYAQMLYLKMVFHASPNGYVNRADRLCDTDYEKRLLPVLFENGYIDHTGRGAFTYKIVDWYLHKG